MYGHYRAAIFLGKSGHGEFRICLKFNILTVGRENESFSLFGSGFYRALVGLRHAETKGQDGEY
jgi:hypothetical protein